MPMDKQPPPGDALRCIELRAQSRRGIALTLEEHKFVTKMHKKYKRWYSATERQVFLKSAPFGSNMEEEL